METFAQALTNGAIPIRTATRQQALQALCSGRSKAALLDYRSTKGMLLEHPPGCVYAAFGFIPLTTTSSLSVGSRPEAAAAADAIRDQLGAMEREDQLGPIYAKWASATGGESRSFFSVIHAQKRNGFAEDARIGAADGSGRGHI